MQTLIVRNVHRDSVFVDNAVNGVLEDTKLPIHAWNKNVTV